MGLPSDQRLGRGSVSLETLALTPQDFFVLSRVEGIPTVRELVASTGLPRAEAEPIVARLVELGALELQGASATPDATGPSPSPVRGRTKSAKLRDQARERRRRLLQAQLAPDAAATEAVRERAPTPASQSPESAREGEAEQAPAALLAPADDPRIDPSLAIPVDDQRRVLALHDRMDALSPFALLGIAPTHEIKAIRRAFHAASRKLHPDAYYGRNLGAYRELLEALFRRVKLVHGQLQDAEVRAPWVDAHLEEQARRRRVLEEERRAVEEAEEAQRRALEAEARRRRQTRAAERIEAERKRFEASKRVEAERLQAEARAAEGAGELAKAANLYRLALQCWPDHAELRQRWQVCLTAARAKRATSAFNRAVALLEVGQAAEATRAFIEAAEAHPTAEHLAHAAEALGTIDPVRTRNYALAALEALGSESGKSAAERARLHLMIGRAFLAAGQRESAREQALVAQRLRPDEAQVRALLNSTKVT